MKAKATEAWACFAYADGMKTTLRIGAGAGYAGDRIPPALELAEKGQLDYLVFECLAERTIALAQLERSKDPASGFDAMLEARMRRCCPRAYARAPGSSATWARPTPCRPGTRCWP